MTNECARALALCMTLAAVVSGCGGTTSGSDSGLDVGAVDAGCLPDDTETRLTPACGSETRTCASDGTWGNWSQATPDQADPECLQGKAQFADRVGCEGSEVRYFRCGSACTWETAPVQITS